METLILPKENLLGFIKNYTFGVVSMLKWSLGARSWDFKQQESQASDNFIHSFNKYLLCAY